MGFIDGSFRIPDELVALVSENRLIPFLGAGFSASLDLPTWEDMLRAVCERLEGGLSFEDLAKATNNDLLQAAEYLYLKHDQQIGPLRQQIERSFSAKNAHPIESAAHVELANLRSSQIYTTNYDDLIEQTYRELGLPHSSVVLPKDVALATADRTQVVKYHGDLAHERTLVLTESSYYKRLDFESPMDLKFRSDLLGKSVLFMGYSFRDVNIRIIWFKLMEMMKDIPEADRRPSYIVRFEPNAVLEELYSAVGLQTIVLNPRNREISQAERKKVLGSFLFELSTRAAGPSRSVKRQQSPTFVSAEALDRAESYLENRRMSPAFNRPAFAAASIGPTALLDRMFSGTVPAALNARWESLVIELLPFRTIDEDSINVLRRLEPSSALTKYVVDTLSTTGSAEAREGRSRLMGLKDLWTKVWSHGISASQERRILKTLTEELRYQAVENADEDIVCLVELAVRLRNGVLQVEDEGDETLRTYAAELVEMAAGIYPAVASMDPDKESAPDVDRLQQQVRNRAARFEEAPLDRERWFAILEALRMDNSRGGLPKASRSAKRLKG